MTELESSLGGVFSEVQLFCRWRYALGTFSAPTAMYSRNYWGYYGVARCCFEQREALQIFAQTAETILPRLSLCTDHPVYRWFCIWRCPQAPSAFAPEGFPKALGRLFCCCFYSSSESIGPFNWLGSCSFLLRLSQLLSTFFRSRTPSPFRDE